MVVPAAAARPSRLPTPQVKRPAATAPTPQSRMAAGSASASRLGAMSTSTAAAAARPATAARVPLKRAAEASAGADRPASKRQATSNSRAALSTTAANRLNVQAAARSGPKKPAAGKPAAGATARRPGASASAGASAAKATADRLLQAEEQLTALAAAKEGLEQLLTEEKAVALLQQTRLAEEQANADRLSAELATTQESLKCTENDLAAAREQLRVTAEQLAASQQMEKDTAAQLCTTREALETSQAELAHERTLVTAARAKIAELEGTEIAHEEERRRLHNTIQELKGNIRVFARVRPLLEASTDTTAEAEDADYAATGGLTLAIPSNDPEHRRLTLLGPARDTVVGDRGEAKSWDFQFDRVFGPHASQEDVFRDISQLVQSVLDGYKVCLFAYGQTGSGKTWTMGTGSPEAEEHRGMIPRAVAQIFATMEAMKEGGWKFDGAHVTHLEVYNETLRDLLASESSSGDCTARTLDIKHGREGNTTVAGLSKHEIASAEDVNGLLRRAARARATGATHSNAHSSRSHSVFQLHVPCDSARGESRRGCLTMVDLAGSERLDKSGAEGGRLKETQAINKSLSALGDVIFALANGERHVPYRNSKLTYLLQHSLGGDSKVLMLVNVSPEPQHQAETLCSLRFAHKVNSCEIGSARTHKRHA